MCALYALLVLLHEYVNRFADRLFDMVACYFPITFTSSPNDPYQVSAEMLVMQLQDCLCGHYDFLDRLIPFLKDKLAHDSLVGRTHALSCLSRVCRDFGIDGIVAHHDSRAIADVVYDTVAGSRDTAEVRYSLRFGSVSNVVSLLYLLKSEQSRSCGSEYSSSVNYRGYRCSSDYTEKWFFEEIHRILGGASRTSSSSCSERASC